MLLGDCWLDRVAQGPGQAMLSFLLPPALERRNTPAALTSVGFLTVVAAAATIFHASSNIAVDVAGGLLTVVGIAAIAGGSALDKVQKL
eukprot:360823-Chlamydomonas_euryale.AAC.2